MREYHIPIELRDVDKITSRFGKLGIGFVNTTRTHPRPLSWKERGAYLPLLFVREGGWGDEFK